MNPPPEAYCPCCKRLSDCCICNRGGALYYGKECKVCLPLSKEKHTPRPWTFHEHHVRNNSGETKLAYYFILEQCPNGKHGLIVGTAALGVQAAKSMEGGEFDEVALANAQVMAAAPDLLAALKGVLRVADRRTDEFDAARAAIAKAEGETL